MGGKYSYVTSRVMNIDAAVLQADPTGGPRQAVADTAKDEKAIESTGRF